MNEFKDWFAFKLENTEDQLKCIICSKPTNQSIFATHYMHKKFRMGACCSEDCYDTYKKKYGV